MLDPEEARTAIPPTSALATVVTAKTTAANHFLQAWPVIAVFAECIAAILRDALAAGAPLATGTLDTVVDQETNEWSELVFRVGVRADVPEMIRWWKWIGARRAELNRSLSERERTILARSIGLHLFPEG